MAQRIIVALLYAVGIVAASLQATGIPQNAEAWIGLAIAFLVGFWGKFSSSQTVIAMNRTVWTEEKRKQDALDELNKGL